MSNLHGIVLHYACIKSTWRKGIRRVTNTNETESNDEGYGKKDVIKWLDTWIMYSISDSKWVSLVQCVPKMARMMVITNEKVN